MMYFKNNLNSITSFYVPSIIFIQYFYFVYIGIVLINYFLVKRNQTTISY